jgi:hypothetical protein
MVGSYDPTDPFAGMTSRGGTLGGSLDITPGANKYVFPVGLTTGSFLLTATWAGLYSGVNFNLLLDTGGPGGFTFAATHATIDNVWYGSSTAEVSTALDTLLNDPSNEIVGASATSARNSIFAMVKVTITGANASVTMNNVANLWASDLDNTLIVVQVDPAFVN